MESKLPYPTECHLERGIKQEVANTVASLRDPLELVPEDRATVPKRVTVFRHGGSDAR